MCLIDTIPKTNCRQAAEHHRVFCKDVVIDLRGKDQEQQHDVDRGQRYEKLVYCRKESHEIFIIDPAARNFKRLYGYSSLITF